MFQIKLHALSSVNDRSGHMSDTQIIVTPGCFGSRQKGCYLASIVLHNWSSLLWGWISFCLLFALFEGAKPYYLRCFSVTYILSNSSQNRCLKVFWKATVYNRDPNTVSQHQCGKLPVLFHFEQGKKLFWAIILHCFVLSIIY